MLSVTPVAGGRQIEAFIRLPGRLSAADPNWVEPLWFERRRFLSPRHNPFFDHAEVALWLAWRGGRPVGRTSAQIARPAPAIAGLKAGPVRRPAAAAAPAGSGSSRGRGAPGP